MVETFSDEINHGDVMHSMVTVQKMILEQCGGHVCQNSMQFKIHI